VGIMLGCEEGWEVGRELGCALGILDGCEVG